MMDADDREGFDLDEWNAAWDKKHPAEKSRTYASPAWVTLELRPPETDEEPWPHGYATVAEDDRRWKLVGCLAVVGTAAAFWGAVAWAVARLLRG